MSTGPIAPKVVTGDADVVDAWIYAINDPPSAPWRDNKITVHVTRPGWPDDAQWRVHFGLHPDQAVALAHRLLELVASFDTAER